ncbi:MAG: hypothetical protein DWI21_08690 [Planctomycetota bacterium]|nr:MAG: hypothetical protein DWI21_08690 [Planctomycetota bacterium]GDY07573.1 hypothetical protein LBMAG52_10590 [Planctomycetia bacterium]
MRNLVWTLTSMVLVVCVSAAAWSSEADELRAKAKAVQNEADRAAKEGRSEEAEKLYRHVKDLLQEAQKHEPKSAKVSGRENELQQQLKALIEKEQHAQKSEDEDALAKLRKLRAATEHELANLREHGERKIAPKRTGKHPPEAVEETGMRIKHIRVAVENLNAAGFHDIAEELAHKADAMEREQAQAHGKIAKTLSPPEKRKHFDPEQKHPEPKGKFAPGHAPVEDLRHELQRLRAELNELREEIKKRP